MILTQTYFELGCPNGYSPLGIYTDFEEPYFPNGYGYALEAGMKVAKGAFLSRLPKGGALLNAKITVTAGSGHPSYNRKLYTLVGDLYEVTKPS